MTNGSTATPSNVAKFPELKGDFVDRLDRAAERLALRTGKQGFKKRQFGFQSAA